MMEYKRCYDLVIGLIEKTSEEFGTRLALNKDKYDLLENICEAVDNMAEEIDCDSLKAYINRITKRLTIEMVCDEVVFKNGRSNEFFKLIQMLNSFSFSKEGDDSICIALNIESMWE